MSTRHYTGIAGLHICTSAVPRGVQSVKVWESLFVARKGRRDTFNGRLAISPTLYAMSRPGGPESHPHPLFSLSLLKNQRRRDLCRMWLYIVSSLIVT